MKWRTEVKIEPLNPWNHNDRVLCMGSCFAENIGQQLKYYLFNSCVNPFGITFNPLSLAAQLEALLEFKQYAIEEIQQNQDKFFHFQFHSKYSGVTAEAAINVINKSVIVGSKFLNEADKLILTFGSSYYYEHHQFGSVNNCHKQEQKNFTKKRASVNEMYLALKKPIEQWLNAKKGREIVVTVSPVRHWKDGVIENSRSKASLLLLAEVLTQFDERISYFPSYEIVLDELRDYRFYESDLLHINKQAVNYVWSKFVNQRLFLMTDLLNTIKQIQDAANHSPFNVSSNTHQNFVKAMLSKIEKLKFQKVTGINDLECHFKKQVIE